MKTFFAALLFCSAFLGGASLAQDGGNVDFKSTELSTGLYMIEGVGGFAGGNMALSVGEDGVILIDDSLPPLSQKLMAAIAKVTDKPVDFVVNTHVHGDHTGGNEAFGKAGATIVAHDNIRKRMLADKPKDALPVITFAHGLTFHLNGQEARVIHLKDAHTDGDAIIHFPGLDLIHTGDLCFNGMFPFIDLNSGGTVDGYIAAQEKIIALSGPNTRIIPGHGPLGNKADMEKNLAVLKDSKQKIAALVAQGKSEDEVLAANPLAEHESYSWVFITTERIIRTIYKDLNN